MAGRGGTFDARIRELSQRVGSGKIRAETEVSQVYAAVQEFDETLAHPSGGQAHYLESSLYDTHNETLNQVADELLDRGPRQGMVDGAERVASGVVQRAPVDLFYLRHSANPRVTDRGETVYDRPPVQRRLTDEELDALAPQRRRRNRG